MSDANIKVEVDTSEIDTAITQIDSALGRTSGGRVNQVGASKSLSKQLTAKQLRELNKQVAISYQLYGTTYPSPVNWLGFASSPKAQIQQVTKKGIRETLTSSLSGMNLSREERILANQLGIPTRVLYNLKRAQKGLSAGVSYSGVVTAIATALIVIDQVMMLRRQLEIQDNQYKQIFQEYKPDLSKAEYEAIKDQSTNQWSKAINYIFRIGG